MKWSLPSLNIARSRSDATNGYTHSVTMREPATESSWGWWTAQRKVSTLAAWRSQHPSGAAPTIWWWQKLDWKKENKTTMLLMSVQKGHRRKAEQSVCRFVVYFVMVDVVYLNANGRKPIQKRVEIKTVRSFWKVWSWTQQESDKRRHECRCLQTSHSFPVIWGDAVSLLWRKRPKRAQEQVGGVEEREESSVSHHGKWKMSLIRKIKYDWGPRWPSMSVSEKLHSVTHQLSRFPPTCRQGECEEKSIQNVGFAYTLLALQR